MVRYVFALALLAQLPGCPEDAPSPDSPPVVEAAATPSSAPSPAAQPPAPDAPTPYPNTSPGDDLWAPGSADAARGEVNPAVPYGTPRQPPPPQPHDPAETKPFTERPPPSPDAAPTPDEHRSAATRAAELGLVDALATRGPWAPTHSLARLDLAGAKAPYTEGGTPSVDGGWARTGDRLELRFMLDGKSERVVCGWVDLAGGVELLCGQEGGEGFAATRYSHATRDGVTTLQLSDPDAEVYDGVPTRIEARAR